MKSSTTKVKECDVKLSSEIFTEEYLIKVIKKVWIGERKYRQGYALLFPFTLTEFGVRCNRCMKSKIDFIKFPNDKHQLDWMNENLSWVKYTKDAAASIEGYCKNCMTRGKYSESGIIAMPQRSNEWDDFYQKCYNETDYFEKLYQISIPIHSKSKGESS